MITITSGGSRFRDTGKVPWGGVQGGYTLPGDASEGVCLGAFRTSPVASQHVEAGEMLFKLRRQ